MNLIGGIGFGEIVGIVGIVRIIGLIGIIGKRAVDTDCGVWAKFMLEDV